MEFITQPWAWYVAGPIIAIIMFSGVILISIGIIGEYILRIFFQSKQRPLFLIDKEIINGEETK